MRLVVVLFPETQEPYIIISRQALDRVQSGVMVQLESLASGEAPPERLEYTYYDFRDTPDEP